MGTRNKYQQLGSTGEIISDMAIDAMFFIVLFDIGAFYVETRDAFVRQIFSNSLSFRYGRENH